MSFINETLNIYRLRIEVLNEVKSQKFSVIEVSDLYGDLLRSRNIFFVKRMILMNLELLNTPILIPYKFSVLYLIFSPLFRKEFQITPDHGFKAKRIKISLVV